MTIKFPEFKLWQVCALGYFYFIFFGFLYDYPDKHFYFTGSQIYLVGSMILYKLENKNA